VESAVADVIASGLRTRDLAGAGETAASTVEMGDAVVQRVAA
jgi:isocitrate/isopropylmalate dehydrogenase